MCLGRVWVGGVVRIACDFAIACLSLGVTTGVTLWETVSVQGPLARGRSEQPSPPHQGLPGHSWEANSSGTDWARGKTFRCMCSGWGQGESDPKTQEARKKQAGDKGDKLSPRQRGAPGQEQEVAVS